MIEIEIFAINHKHKGPVRSVVGGDILTENPQKCRYLIYSKLTLSRGGGVNCTEKYSFYLCSVEIGLKPTFKKKGLSEEREAHSHLA